MKIEDCLYLYLGCEMLCVATDEDEETEYCKEGDVGILTLVNHGEISILANEDSESWNIGIEFPDGKWVADWYSSRNFKPILRPLSDMTVEEAEFKTSAAKEGKPTILVNAEITYFLLKQSFDLFGLIEAGLAIDKTKL